MSDSFVSVSTKFDMSSLTRENSSCDSCMKENVKTYNVEDNGVPIFGVCLECALSGFFPSILKEHIKEGNITKENIPGGVVLSKKAKKMLGV